MKIEVWIEDREKPILVEAVKLVVEQPWVLFLNENNEEVARFHEQAIEAILPEKGLS